MKWNDDVPCQEVQEGDVKERQEQSAILVQDIPNLQTRIDSEIAGFEEQITRLEKELGAVQIERRKLIRVRDALQMVDRSDEPDEDKNDLTTSKEKTKKAPTEKRTQRDKEREKITRILRKHKEMSVTDLRNNLAKEGVLLTYGALRMRLNSWPDMFVNREHMVEENGHSRKRVMYRLKGG